jgi:hypothetical protein
MWRASPRHDWMPFDRTPGSGGCQSPEFLGQRKGDNLGSEGVDHWWKEVRSRSEMEKGSFVALWIAEFFRKPPALPEKLIKLGNNYVHKGSFRLRVRQGTAKRCSAPKSVGLSRSGTASMTNSSTTTSWRATSFEPVKMNLSL